MNPKEIAGIKSADYVKSGMTIGLGTGSTAFFAIQEIGRRVKEGLAVKAIATSIASEKLARELNIPIVGFADFDYLDVSIDGADEVNPDLNLIKGGGGALLREKIVSYATKHYVTIVDESKYVDVLGKFKLPVEVIPFGWEQTGRELKKLGADFVVRQKDGETFITDNQNYILDCDFFPINDPATLEAELHKIPGVAECGLFINQTQTLIIGKEDGTLQIIEK